MEIINFVKGLTAEEKLYVEQLISDFGEEERTLFLIKYKIKRRNPYLYLVLSMFGFACLSGFHRFYAKQYLMGILQFCTCGFFFVGTLIDAMSFMKRSTEANIAISEKLAFEIRDRIYQLDKSHQHSLS